jgi:hypothetical protein
MNGHVTGVLGLSPLGWFVLGFYPIPVPLPQPDIFIKGSVGGK